MHRYCARLVLMSCLLSISTIQAAEIPQLEQVFSEAGIWNLSPEGAISRWSANGFEWTEQTLQSNYRWFMPVHDSRNVAIHEGARELPPVEVFGLNPVEVIFKFQDNKLMGMTAMFFTRGDSGELSMKEFTALAKALSEKLNVWAGSKGTVQRGDGRGGGATIDRMIWTRDTIRADLEWGYTRISGNQGRPEFVRLRFVPFNPEQRAQVMGGKVARENVAPAAGAPGGIAGAIEMKKRVEKRPAGDHVLSVPMVDQGPKGYCVAAVLERVARFYGREFDQHEAAQLANTSAENGTSSEKMIEALRKMAGLLKMHCVGKTDMDDTASFVDNKRRIQLTVPKEFAAMLKIYNKEAKKAGLPQYDVWAALDGGGINAVYNKLDKDILRKARLAQKNEMERFRADVIKNIDAGVPLVWSVLVGIVKEKGLPADETIRGHMRMIIGYNLQTQDILYTDTWGLGHEEKRMSMEDAWVINKGYFVVTPQGVRF
jgi:hypothetical protein